jgi:mono/diheme cytochrome c family protein
VYYDHGCYGCHGFSGYGRKDLNHTGSPILVNEDVFIAFLRGRADMAPIFPVTDMPNYPANSLSDTQAHDLYAYIRSMPATTVEVGDIPVLRNILEEAERRTYQP